MNLFDIEREAARILNDLNVIDRMDRGQATETDKLLSRKVYYQDMLTKASKLHDALKEFQKEDYPAEDLELPMEVSRKAEYALAKAKETVYRTHQDHDESVFWGGI